MNEKLDTPLDLILNGWINGVCPLYTIGIIDPLDLSENLGESFFYIREPKSKKLLLPIFTSVLMAKRLIDSHPLKNAKIVQITRKKFNVLARKHKVDGITPELSYEPFYFEHILLNA